MQRHPSKPCNVLGIDTLWTTKTIQMIELGDFLKGTDLNFSERSECLRSSV